MTGSLTIVGLGPGTPEWITPAAQAALDAGLDRDPEVRAAIVRALASRLKEQVLTPRLKEASAPVPEARLRELSEANQANGALLARRRREVNWALRHLGRSESSGAYDANGQTDVLRGSRPLAVV